MLTEQMGGPRPLRSPSFLGNQTSLMTAFVSPISIRCKRVANPLAEAGVTR